MKPIRSPHSSGISLIELLIMVAVITIIFGGGFSVWAHQVKMQRMLAYRIQIATVLDAQMAALMKAQTLPEPSPEQQPLPVPLSELLTPPNVTGYYTLRPTDTPPLVQIDVVLQLREDAATQNFRLSAVRSMTGGQP